MSQTNLSQSKRRKSMSGRKGEEKLTKVTVLGAAGGIGQPLSLLLMLHPEYIQHLALYDLNHTRGVGADLSHVDRQCKVTSHLGPEELPEAVKDANVIIILAGIAQKPGMSRDDLFGTNAKIMFDLARVCAQHAPDAFLAIVSNPVNSLVPLVNLVYQRYLAGSKVANPAAANGNPPPADGAKGPGRAQSPKPAAAGAQSPTKPANEGTGELSAYCRRIFGVTTLDVVRASTLTAKSFLFTNQSEHAGLFKDPLKVTVPVVGGHAGKTILPLLSRATPHIESKRLTGDMKATNKLIESIQEAGIEVLNAKKGAGSATLAMAYAACRFTISLLRAQADEPNIVECAYVRLPSSVADNLEYFSLPLQLGKHGYIKPISPLGKILPYEQQQVEEACRLLRANVAKGEDFAKEQLSVEKN